MASSVGSVTHSEKFTFPSPSVSYRLQASRVLLPVTLISSQFQVTWRKPATEVSTQSCVRSFWPGSSFAPAVSLIQLSTARTDEELNTATPSARNVASATTSMSCAGDFVNARNRFLERLKKDENIDGLLSFSIREGSPM